MSHALREKLRRLERETSELVQALAAEPDVELPGTHLALEAHGHRAVINASLVQELVRLVALSPVGGAAPAVVGTFTYRGQACFAIDLAALISGAPPRPPPLDAQLVVLGSAVPMALLVDRVEGLVSSPRVAATAGASPVSAPALGPVLVKAGNHLCPVLDAARLAALVETPRE